MKMLRPLFIIWAASTLLLAGCAGGSQTSEGDASSPQGSNANSLTPVPDGSTTGAEGARPFSDVPPSPDIVATLLPPTSPDQRAAQVQTGRADPFAPVTAMPVMVPAAPSAPRSPQALPTVPVTSLPSLPPVPFSTVPLPVQAAPQPAPLATAPSQPAIAPPQPAAPVVPVAQTIEVSGVVQVGGETSIIVRVPDEGSSRSASVGDRLANGRVLVKRIEVGQGSDPVVVLEQDGVEIVRPISLMGS